MTTPRGRPLNIRTELRTAAIVKQRSRLSRCNSSAVTKAWGEVAPTKRLALVPGSGEAHCVAYFVTRQAARGRSLSV